MHRSARLAGVKKKIRGQTGVPAPKKTGTRADPAPGVPLCPGLRFGGINVS